MISGNSDFAGFFNVHQADFFAAGKARGVVRGECPFAFSFIAVYIHGNIQILIGKIGLSVFKTPDFYFRKGGQRKCGKHKKHKKRCQ